jgi:hypothetical protein
MKDWRLKHNSLKGLLLKSLAFISHYRAKNRVGCQENLLLYERVPTVVKRENNYVRLPLKTFTKGSFDERLRVRVDERLRARVNLSPEDDKERKRTYRDYTCIVVGRIVTIHPKWLGV